MSEVASAGDVVGDFIQAFLRMAVAFWFHTRPSVGYGECRVIDQVLGPYQEDAPPHPEFEALKDVWCRRCGQHSCPNLNPNEPCPQRKR